MLGDLGQLPGLMCPERVIRAVNDALREAHVLVGRGGRGRHIAHRGADLNQRSGIRHAQFQAGQISGGIHIAVLVQDALERLVEGHHEGHALRVAVLLEPGLILFGSENDQSW